MEPVKAAIIYYSATGTVHALARAAAAAALKVGRAA
jgi:NAD(P)H dehydrogenase (quinone)